MSLHRPILKYLPTPETQGSPAYRGRVHFPPTPEISATYFAHSARIYDRSAIVVSPNVCSLPQRHCPDRTYVLSEGKGEAHLLKSVQPVEMQDDDEAADATPSSVEYEYDQGLTRMDYFSIPGSLSTTPEMVSWPGLDNRDGLFSSSKEKNSSLGLLSAPMLDVVVHDTHAGEASAPHDQTQGALSFLPPALPIARKRNLSQRGRDRQDRSHSIVGTENGDTPLAQSRRSRRASSFSNDVPPDSGCLGGF
jgi:hypothetical protein